MYISNPAGVLKLSTRTGPSLSFAEGVQDTRRDTREAARKGLDCPVAESQRERPLEDVEHVVEFAVAVRRGTGEAGRERALGEEEGAAGVLARGLD